MDFNDFFRGFFGFNRMRPDSFDDTFASINEYSDESSSVDDEDFPVHHRNFELFFNNDTSSLFKEMEDMFNNMFLSPLRFDDMKGLDIPSESMNPRDFMLKKSDPDNCKEHQCPVLRSPRLEYYDSGSQRTYDSDLDDRVAREGLSVLKEEKPLVKSKSWSFSKSFSKSFVRLPDGTVEEHQTTTDSSGNTVTKIKKSVGDKTYQVITQRDKNGIVEKKEDFINMDENELPEFQKRWDSAKSRKKTEDNLSTLSISAPPGDPKYLSIFERFFGRKSQ